MSYAVYSFEAKQIQSYILATNKLKDQIGASEQIESLCTKKGLLDQITKELNLKPKYSRKAGGAFVAFFDGDNARKQAENLQAVWTFVVQKTIPSLHFAHGIGEGSLVKEAVDQAFIQQRISNQYLFPELPMAPPMAEFAPRSGRAASEKKEDDLLDEATLQKRNQKTSLITDKLGHFGKEGLTWPTTMPKDSEEEEEEEEKAEKEDIFPLLDDNVIGIVHADINNLGTILIKTSTEYYKENKIQEIKDFSDEIDKAIISSVQESINRTLTKHLANNGVTMPARPLVLAGDDITFIVRGDLALKFTEYLLKEIEETLATKLKSHKTTGLPEKLTACAGIAYIKASQPFYQGYKLAESLCEYAKQNSKKREDDNNLNHVPSSIAFHRITTSMIDRYEDIIKQELTIYDEKQNLKLLLTQQPYFVGENNELPRLTDLQTLKSAFDNVGKGRIRQLLTLLHQSSALAEKEFSRWCDVMEERQSASKKEIHELLKVMTQKTEDKNQNEFNLSDLWEADKRTPIADAIALTQIAKEDKS